MARLWLIGVWRLVKIAAVRIHNEERTLATLIENLGDNGWTWLSFVFAAWRAVLLIVNHTAN